MDVGLLAANQDRHVDGILSVWILYEGEIGRRGFWEEVRSCKDTCIAFSSRESPSAPKLITAIPRFLHSLKIYFHLCNTHSAVNLLLVPIQDKQKAGTPSHSGCAMYTNAYLATAATEKASCIASKETATKVSASGSPFLSHGSTNPTSLFVSLSYSTLAIRRVASSPIATIFGALY